MKTLRLLNLYCNESNIYDNNTPKSNKVFLTVDYGISRIFGPESMNSALLHNSIFLTHLANLF
jgi:hypothetical protein